MRAHVFFRCSDCRLHCVAPSVPCIFGSSCIIRDARNARMSCSWSKKGPMNVLTVSENQLSWRWKFKSSEKIASNCYCFNDQIVVMPPSSSPWAIWSNFTASRFDKGCCHALGPVWLARIGSGWMILEYPKSSCSHDWPWHCLLSTESLA